MDERVEICVPGPPVPKARAADIRTGKGWRRITPEKTKQYEKMVAWHAREAMGSRAPFEGPVRIALGAYLPIAPSWPKCEQEAALAGSKPAIKKPDCDNLVKSGLDALKRIVWLDDAQVVELIAFKRYDANPRLTIIVEKL